MAHASGNHCQITLAFVLKVDISNMCYKNDTTYMFDSFWKTITASVFVAVQ